MIAPPNFNFPQSGEALTSDIFNMERLRALPEGTFGRALAAFIDRNDIALVTTAGKLTHDFVHVLTGYDSTPIGEAEVLAFFLGSEAAQKSTATSLMDVLRTTREAWKLGFLQSLYASGKLTEFLSKRMWDAYFLGRESGFKAERLKPERYWEMPVAQVRALYHGLT